jgi:hypothetical protein
VAEKSSRNSGGGKEFLCPVCERDTATGFGELTRELPSSQTLPETLARRSMSELEAVRARSATSNGLLRDMSKANTLVNDSKTSKLDAVLLQRAVELMVGLNNGLQAFLLVLAP